MKFNLEKRLKDSTIKNSKTQHVNEKSKLNYKTIKHLEVISIRTKVAESRILIKLSVLYYILIYFQHFYNNFLEKNQLYPTPFSLFLE